MSVRFEMRWPGPMIDRVDALRGDVPRARWIRKAVEAECKRLEQTSGYPHKHSTESKGKEAPNTPTPTSAAGSAPSSPNGETCPSCNQSDRVTKTVIGTSRGFKCRCGEIWKA